MKKIFVILFALIGLSITTYSQSVIIDGYGNNQYITYGKTPVWIQVDDSWVKTYLYENECQICHTQFDCIHRHVSMWTIVPTAAYIGTKIYLSKPIVRPPYYAWHHTQSVSRPHKPNPQHQEHRPSPNYGIPQCTPHSQGAPVGHYSSRPQSSQHHAPDMRHGGNAPMSSRTSDNHQHHNSRSTVHTRR